MLPPKRVKRTKTAEQALASLQRLCARAERSSGDALRLMAGWEVEPAKRQEVLQRLIADRFIDDRRYAEAFVREKTSLSSWGEYKIRATLKRKGISDEIIAEVCNSSETLHTTERLSQRLQRKARTYNYKTLYELKTKLLRHALSLGFQMDEALEGVEQVMKTINTDSKCDEDTSF